MPLTGPEIDCLELVSFIWQGYVYNCSMKETLTLSGKVELSRTEITQAIDEWLKKNKKLSIVRAIYLTKDNTVASGVFDVRQEVAMDRTIPEFSLPTRKVDKPEKNMPKGWRRINVGVFQTIQGFIDEYRSKGLKQVDFDRLLEDIVYFHPRMDRKRLEIYIRDRRQLKGVSYDSKSKKVSF